MITWMIFINVDKVIIHRTTVEDLAKRINRFVDNHIAFFNQSR